MVYQIVVSINREKQQKRGIEFQRVGQNCKYGNRECLIEEEMTAEFCKSQPSKEIYAEDTEELY